MQTTEGEEHGSGEEEGEGLWTEKWEGPGIAKEQKVMLVKVML